MSVDNPAAKRQLPFVSFCFMCGICASCMVCCMCALFISVWLACFMSGLSICVVFLLQVWFVFFMYGLPVLCVVCLLDV